MRAVAPFVEETVVIDSSHKRESDQFLSELRSEKVRIYRILPLGFVEPLRGYALKKIRTEYVLYLDADEWPSEQLLSVLRSCTKYSAYRVPRVDIRTGGTEYQTRVLRVADVSYRGMIHENTVVRGDVGRLSPPNRILHDYGGPAYHTAGDRLLRYSQIESLETPPTLGTLSRVYPWARWLGALDTNRIIPSFLYLPIRFLLLLVHTWSMGSVTQSVVETKYALGVHRAFRRLSPEYRAECPKIASDIWKAGGAIAYLNFDDEAYVEALSESYDWQLPGIEVFKKLVFYRFKHGAPAPSEPAFWTAGRTD